MGDTIRQYDETSSDSEPFPVSESEYEPSEYSIESRESPTDRGEDVASTSNYVPSLLEEENGMPKSKGKKRIRNELQWKRNIRKRNKTAGQEYISVKGNIVPAKTFVAKDCMCLKKCHAKFSQERREALFKNFYALESHDLQTAFIYGQIRVQVKERSYSTQNIKKKENARYYFLSDERGKECQVCKEFFKLSLGVSDGRITRALATKKTTGTPRTDGRGKTSSANKTSEVKIEGVKNFINKFPVYDSHYSREKNPARKYLSPDLDITKLFNLYKAEVPNNNVSMFLFRRIFNQDFNLSFHPPISDSCRKCDAFNVKIKAAIANNEECHIIQAEQELHQRKAEAARQGMNQDAAAAVLDNDLTVISFDLMKTLATPIISTGIAYYKRQLWTFCFGIHNLQTHVAHMYMWNESIASRGSQEIGSCIAHYIKNYVGTKKLIMYSDQCGGQNRNFKMAALCTYIVASNEFTVESIDHKFLVSGHSYLPNDQDFGLIEKNKKHYKNIYVPSDWMQVVSDTRKKNKFHVVAMKSTDFFSTQGLEKALTHRKTTERGEKVEWLRIQWLRYSKEKPGFFKFKYSNNEEVFFYEANMTKRDKKNFLELATFNQRLFAGPRPIQVAKYKDLLALLDYIPPVHHEFYKLLLHSERAAEDLDAIADDDN